MRAHHQTPGSRESSLATAVLVGASAAALTYVVARELDSRRARTATTHGPLDDTRRALGGGRGVLVREVIRLERPIAEVYAYWRRLENLPTFMPHLVEVTQTGHRSHWTAVGPAGFRVEWDAEIISDEPERLLSWHSVPGARVTTAGSVTFRRVAEDSTTVTVRLQYALPGGKAGAVVSALFGHEPSQMIREDLRRFKQLLEAGEVARADAPRAGATA